MGDAPRLGSGLYAFNEDFRRDAPTCLDQSVRALALRRAMVRTSTMQWVPVRSGGLQRDQDYGNPETPSSANVDVRQGPDGLELVMGGTTMSDPHGSPYVGIPE